MNPGSLRRLAYPHFPMVERFGARLDAGHAARPLKRQRQPLRYWWYRAFRPRRGPVSREPVGRRWRPARRTGRIGAGEGMALGEDEWIRV